MLHVTIPKFTGIDTDKKTPSKFPWFDILKWVSNNIHGVYYTTDNSSDPVDIEVSNTEAPEYIWWCPNCVLVVAGTKIYMGDVICISPLWHSGSQIWRLVSVWLEVPDIDFWYVFTLLIIKDMLVDKGIGINFKLGKGNVRASSMRIGVNSTKKLKQYANRMNVSRNLRPTSFSL